MDIDLCSVDTILGTTKYTHGIKKKVFHIINVQLKIYRYVNILME